MVKNLKQMNNRDLLGLLKIYKILVLEIKKHRKQDEFGFDISVNQLFSENVYNVISTVSNEKTTNYEDFGFKYIEYLTTINTYTYELFIEDLKNKVRFINNIQKELNQLVRFQDYYKNFTDWLNELNSICTNKYYFITTDDGNGLYVEFNYIKIKENKVIYNEDYDNYDVLKKGNLNKIIKQEVFNNFLCKYEELSEEYEIIKIF